MKSVAYAALAAAFIDNTYAAFETRDTRLSPVVGDPVVGASGSTTNICVFENDNDHWCFDLTPPLVKLFWEWKQDFDVTTITTQYPEEIKYYRWQFWPGIQTKAFIVTNLRLQNLLDWEGRFEFSEFDTQLMISTIFTGDYRVCLGVGYNIE
jgi:hypothetical protein